MTPAAQGSTIVRLHHRRCGWTWVAVCSLIGLVVYVAVDAHLFDNLTGTSELLSVIPGFVLLALVLTGLIVAIVYTVRLRRADAVVRATARANLSHYPLPVHASRYPPRHAGSWVFGIVMLAAMTTIAVAILPRTGALRGIPGRRGKPGHLQPAALQPGLQQGRLSYGDRRLPLQERRGCHLG